MMVYGQGTTFVPITPGFPDPPTFPNRKEQLT